MQTNRKRKLKIGIDVGGTFTHAVAVDVHAREIAGKACVPTTHESSQGVAAGVIGSMKQLMDQAGIDPDEILLIAHSTTQATNALLEGDVAQVGILAMGKGLEGRLARSQARLDDILLAPSKFLPVSFRYLDISQEPSAAQILDLLEEMKQEGSKVFVATETFGPDSNENEKRVCRIAHDNGFTATAACDLSQLFGIRVRTRTAVVNASMMPRMIETANLTEEAVRQSGIKAPLMVMRSDGGIMDIAEMRRRPILTMLSGPAAGVAAALMYARISDGIFVEVGGTSTDISVIRNGAPQIRTAQIGNNRLSLKTIDVRTLGVGGGSIPRLDKNKIIDVGPRSAHIARLSYASYTDQDDFSQIELENIRPLKGDPADYLKIKRKDGNFTLTPTAASWYLKLVNESGHGEANQLAVNSALENVAKRLKKEPAELAEEILSPCSQKIGKTIRSLIREYKLDRKILKLYGGGGGAGALVPHASAQLQLPYLISPDSEVISAIGAAMGMIRDTIEKSVFSPAEQDIIAIRQAASESVISMGARPESVEVQIEIDNANKKLIAVATGSSDMQERPGRGRLSREQLLEEAALLLQSPADTLSWLGNTNLLSVLGYRETKKGLLGLWSDQSHHVLVMTHDGVLKRRFRDAIHRVVRISEVKATISEMVEDLRSYGDAGELMPDLFVVVSGKILDMSGLIKVSQILSLVEFDLQSLKADDEAIIVARKKR